MRRLNLVEFLSVDGVAQGLAGPDGDFPYPGWGLDYPVDTDEDPAAEPFAATTAYLFGRRTFTEMAAFWPGQPAANPMAASLNSTQKYVVSTTLPDPEWQPTTVIRSDVEATVAGLKAARAGDIVVLGSGRLARSLLAAGLVDGFTLYVHPLLLGAGERLFGELPGLSRLELDSVRRTGRGSVELRYSLGGA